MTKQELKEKLFADFHQIPLALLQEVWIQCLKDCGGIPFGPTNIKIADDRAEDVAIAMGDYVAIIEKTVAAAKAGAFEMWSTKWPWSEVMQWKTGTKSVSAHAKLLAAKSEDVPEWCVEYSGKHKCLKGLKENVECTIITTAMTHLTLEVRRIMEAIDDTE